MPAVVGVGFIVKLMTSQCEKQDEKQAGRYGDDAEYKAWVENSGCRSFPSSRRGWYRC